MLASKTFLKKTKKGSIVKVVREHYLRDDVWCGVEGCVVCRQGDSATLNAFSILQSDLCPQPHFTLPDTNVILHQIDFLEDPVMKNVVVLQVALQEVSVCSIITKAYLEGIVVFPLQHWNVQGGAEGAPAPPNIYF